MILTSRSLGENQRLNLDYVRFAIGETALGDIGFFNPANKQQMTAQIQHVCHFTLKINRALLNKGGVTQFAIKHSELADRHFVHLGARCDTTVVSFLNRELNLDIASIDAVELEYAAPGKLAPRNLLGESSGKRGSGQTSPDVAILFTCNDGKCGIFLVENKYTEHHFYACSAAKKTISNEHSLQGLKPNPNPGRCRNIQDLLENPASNCHQVSWGRKYWSILAKSLDNNAMKNLPYCPAMSDGYQLFRQQALAQGIAEMGLFDHVFSGVAYDERNTKLIGCLNDLGMTDFRKDWPSLFNTGSKVKFHCFSHQELVLRVTRSRSAYIQKWSKYVRDRYGY